MSTRTLAAKLDRIARTARRRAGQGVPKIRTYWTINDETLQEIDQAICAALPDREQEHWHTLWRLVGPKLAISTETHQIAMYNLSGQELDDLERLVRIAEQSAASLPCEFEANTARAGDVVLCYPMESECT